MSTDERWQQEIRKRIIKETSYIIWKEWYDLVWCKPTNEELELRVPNT